MRAKIILDNMNGQPWFRIERSVTGINLTLYGDGKEITTYISDKEVSELIDALTGRLT